MDKAWSQLDAVESLPDKVSGTWVFRGTRIPVAALFENLRDGATIDQFLEWFAGVERADVASVLEHGDESEHEMKAIHLNLGVLCDLCGSVHMKDAIVGGNPQCCR